MQYGRKLISMFSEEHRLFIKRRKRNQFYVRFTQIFILIFFFILWQCLADFHVINTFIFSSPKQMFSTIIGLHKTGDLYQHIWVTVYETLISFGLGTFLGLIIASILWWFPFISKVTDPYLTILNSLPKVALGPIIIIWCGAGIRSIIFMALLISLIITIINIYQSFINTDKNKIKLMQSLKASKWQIYTKLIFPNSIKDFISTLKINISMSLIGVIMGEFLVSKEGIGYLIMYGSQVFNLNLVIAGIFILCLVAAVMYYCILYLEKWLTR